MTSLLLIAAASSFLGVSALTLYFYLKGLRISRRTNIPWVSTLEIIRSPHIIEGYHTLVQKHGPILLQYFGFAIITVCDVETAKFVLKDAESSFSKQMPSASPGLLRLWDRNLLNSMGEEYRKHRTILEPYFRSESLRSFSSTFLSKSLCLADEIEKRVGQDVDVAQWMSYFAIDVLGTTILGFELDAMSGKASEMFEAVNIFLREVSNPLRMIHPWVDKIPFLQSNKELAWCVNILEDHVGGVIEKKLKESATKKAESLDMFDNLIENLNTEDPSQRLTKGNVAGNMLLMILAGFDTTATALTWALYFLATNPEIQQRAFEEVNTVLQGSHPDIENIKELQYLNMFIKETMRHTPPAGVVPGRVAEEEVAIPNTPYIIPKGAMISYSIFSIHRDPKHWPNPDKFNPDHFLPENVQKRHPYAYMPFSAGRRVCIGQQFSLIEQQIALSVVLQRFKVFPVTENPVNKAGVLANPVELKVRFEKR